MDTGLMDVTSTLAEMADATGLMPGAVVRVLNEEAAGWHLCVGVDGPLAVFYVAGEVYPLRGDGTRAKRGKRPFFGSRTVDAVRALYLGLHRMREVEQ